MNTKKRILIVEDEIALLSILHKKLESEEFTVFDAKNGEQGFEIALQEKPDLILLDIVMPVMDGITMLKKLRTESEWGKNAKVIMLTNLSDSEKVAEAMLFGFHSYLVKSDWKINDVVQKVKEKLEL
ncbi:response regulator [Candidatus Kuenenbacteria bacterium HGW-Kuenenbacteria-1]|uniref:Response regulator n=1 Tax=Candidatus Kuenenbacteria bacterium HGW-Kuenenbacteria-1 TaxID=2013812 RepID=A0A2N1UPD7_9BACT|nr:MAG: response regulator [Candidatus Kuenenbacteria bacterium HGW-Kuenenbacteria-1]